MDIPLVSATSVAPLVSATALAIEQAQNAALLSASLTTVDLSPLGRFLSATALFQKRTLELQIAAGSPATAQEPVSESDAIAISAQALAVAFNALQTSETDTSGLPPGTFDGQSFAALFAQQSGGQTVPAGDAEDAALASLAAVGLTFVPGAAPDASDQLTVDLPALQAAFERDPDGTAAVLNNTANAFSSLAGIAPEPEAVAGTISPANELAPGAPVAQQTPDLPSPEDAFLRALLSENATVIAAPADDADAVAAPANPLAPAIATGDPLAVAGSAPPSIPAAELQPLVNAAPVPAPVVATPVNSLEIDQEVALEVNRALAEQAALATRNAAIASDQRTERLAVEVRAALSAADEARALARDDQERADARALDQRRQQQAVPQTDAADDNTPVVPLTVTATVPVRAMPQDQEAAVVARPLPAQAPLERALPAARDPAVAAAIAAYSLNTGPFAALNARQEMAAPRVKIVPAVSTVAKVAAIDTDSATKGGTDQFR